MPLKKTGSVVWAAGMNDFLAKPIALQALKLAFTQWLETAD